MIGVGTRWLGQPLVIAEVLAGIVLGPSLQPLRLVVVLAGPRDSASRRRVLAQVARLAARGLAEELARTESPAATLRRLAALEL